MSDATKRMRDFLTISPSVVFPDEVLELFEPVEKEVTRLSDENAELRELLSMYMTFTRAMACDYVFQIAHPDGMGKVMDEAKMRKRAMELGIEWCR